MKCVRRPLAIAHRLDDDLVPEQGAIRAVVANQDPCLLAALDRFAHALARLLVPVVALQDAQVGSEEGGDWIAAHLREGGVGVDDRVIGRGRIADHDAFGGALDEGSPCLRRPVVHVFRLHLG